MQIETSLARQAANQIAASQQNESGGVSSVRYLGFQYTNDLLSVAGFTPEIVNALQDYVIFLPRVTTINANTASEFVLSATLAPLSLADAKALIAKRTQSPFHNLNDLTVQLAGTQTEIDAHKISLATNYFLVHGRISLQQNGLQIVALVERNDRNTAVIWVREI